MVLKVLYNKQTETCDDTLSCTKPKFTLHIYAHDLDINLTQACLHCTI